MGDPLADPRAQQLLRPIRARWPTGLEFRKVASEAERRRRLFGRADDGTWTGSAADAFRTQLGKLPGDLDKVQQSYGEVAQALDVYEGDLGPLQTQFRSLARQLTTALGNLSTAQGALSTAKGNLTTATRRPTRPPPPRRWSTDTPRCPAPRPTSAT